jgi:hypothetical protein
MHVDLKKDYVCRRDGIIDGSPLRDRRKLKKNQKCSPSRKIPKDYGKSSAVELYCVLRRDAGSSGSNTLLPSSGCKSKKNTVQSSTM